MGSESLPLILKRCYVISLFLGREGWVPPQSQQEMCAAGKVWQAQGKAAWCSVAPGLRERERLAVVRWRHRPLSRGESGGCAPAFEALPPTNSGLPISTHCVDPLATPLLPPWPFVCLIRTSPAISSAFLSGVVCVCGCLLKFMLSMDGGGQPINNECWVLDSVIISSVNSITGVLLCFTIHYMIDNMSCSELQ